MRSVSLASVVSLTIAACAAAGGGAQSGEDLARRFVKAVNARSQSQQRLLIHPGCLVNLSSSQEAFIEEVLSRDFRNTIPDQFTLKVTPVPERSLPFSDRFFWKVKPSHQFEIEYSTGERSGTSITRFLAKDRDNWFIVLPVPRKSG